MKKLRDVLAKTIIAISLTAGFAGISKAEPRKKSWLERNPIYAHLKVLRPSMPHKYALRMSNLLYKYSRRYGTDPHLSVALGMTETSLRQINRKETVAVKNEAGYTVYKKAVTDIGVWQLHVRTIALQGLDPELLQHDLEYQVKEHIKLLAKKIKLCSKKRIAKRWNIPRHEAYSCYHSVTPKFRKLYVNKTEKFMMGFTLGNN